MPRLPTHASCTQSAFVQGCPAAGRRARLRELPYTCTANMHGCMRGGAPDQPQSPGCAGFNAPVRLFTTLRVLAGTCLGPLGDLMRSCSYVGMCTCALAMASARTKAGLRLCGPCTNLTSSLYWLALEAP